MTVKQLLESLDSAELSEWLAYLQIERDRDKPDEAEVWKKAFKAHG
jgi:hypothetical protein